MDDFKQAYYDLLQKNAQLNAKMNDMLKGVETAKERIASYIDGLTDKFHGYAHSMHEMVDAHFLGHANAEKAHKEITESFPLTIADHESDKILT